MDLQNLLVAEVEHSKVLRGLMDLQNLLVAEVEHSNVLRGLMDLQNLLVAEVERRVRFHHVDVEPPRELLPPPLLPVPTPVAAVCSASLHRPTSLVVLPAVVEPLAVLPLLVWMSCSEGLLVAALVAVSSATVW